MIFERVIAHKIRDISDRTKARVAFGRDVGENVRIVGRPSVVRDGDIHVGANVVIVSAPAAVTIVAHEGASIEIGDGAVIESGAVIRAHERVVIPPGAHVAAGAIIDDEAPESASTSATPSEETIARIREVVASVAPSANDADAEVDLRTLAGWDSLAALRVIVSLEKEFGVTLPHDLFTESRTLASLVAFTINEAA